jgi:hypothetical protein
MEVERLILGQSGPNRHLIALQSEDDAWSLLEKLQAEDAKVPDAIEVGKWASMELWLQGQRWDENITPSIFPLYEQLQKLIHHTYAEIKYGDATRRLTNDELDDLKIFIKIGKGSSKPKSDWQDALLPIATEALKKMTPRQVFILCIILMLGVGGVVVWRQHIDVKSKERIAELTARKEEKIAELANEERIAMLETIQKMTEAESARMMLFANIVNTKQELQTVRDDLNKLQDNKVRAAAQADQSEIGGVKLTNKMARELIKNGIAESEPVRLDGEYRIKNLNWEGVEEGKKPRMKLENCYTNETVWVSFDKKQLSEEVISLLKNTEWQDGDKVIKTSINATKVNGIIKDAVLVDVQPSKLLFDVASTTADAEEDPPVRHGSE